ncbi:prepilin-type N-terminal cleavage/methylation domain-containing protein [Clostridium perfringens]|nr:prepilin-type N-terminal cleavage/methylation domain-containing protein [Clostridium perfringens]
MGLIKSRQSNLANKKKKGFTLIELIVVIAIIAILAAIAIPNFLSIQRKARVKSDVASAKSIYDATSALIAQSELKPGANGKFNITATLNDTNQDANADLIENYLDKTSKGNFNSQSINGSPFIVKITEGEESPKIVVYVKNTESGDGVGAYTEFYPSYTKNYDGN